MLSITQFEISMTIFSFPSSKRFILLFFLLACQGEEGPIGPAGEDGNDGASGLNSLVNVATEPTGSNCENGGIKVDVGIDNNANGSLDTDEILSTSYVCNGADGNTSLTSVTTEPAGSNCESGGIRIDSGLDINNDGNLNGNEITATAYVCNGVDGNSSLIKTTNEAAGDNCENGGIRIDSGIDMDGNGILDDIEVVTTAYVCHGIEGNNSLTKITNEESGEFCENGGIKIDSGMDDNGDGTLDDVEIDVTRYVCNGVDGGYDEQIRFVMQGGATTTSSIGTIRHETLVKFDIRNYIGVDSIIFVANPYVLNASNFAFVELYNSTDDEVITNSLLTSNNLGNDAELINTSNLINEFPKKEISIGIKLRSSLEGEFSASGTSSHLFLFRNK